MKFFAVIDTNVIVSAFLKWDSIPGFVLQSVFEGLVIPVFNEQILEEYSLVLKRKKFGFNQERIIEVIEQIKLLGIHEEKLIEVKEEMPDPKDIVFYSVALAHGNKTHTHLVTGNTKHFPRNPIVVTPREFLEIIGILPQEIFVSES
ncbi:MAG: putative toxin-antitoxin system toxin component, PIN family [Fibrobacter sp.]|nr:putative toxin-antitoxin system toxin component, PIN family [Fibrobacter sp.]